MAHKFVSWPRNVKLSKIFCVVQNLSENLGIASCHYRRYSKLIYFPSQPVNAIHYQIIKSFHYLCCGFSYSSKNLKVSSDCKIRKCNITRHYSLLYQTTLSDYFIRLYNQTTLSNYFIRLHSNKSEHTDYLLSRACSESCTDRIAEVCRLVDLNSSIR